MFVWVCNEHCAHVCLFEGTRIHVYRYVYNILCVFIYIFINRYSYDKMSHYN